MIILNRSLKLSSALIFALISWTVFGLPLLAQQVGNSAPIELKSVQFIPSIDLETQGIYLNNAYSISLDHEHSLLIANSKDGNILKFGSKGDFLAKVGRFGQAPGEFEFPVKVCPTNNAFYVLDSFRSCITVFDRNGIFQRQIKLFRSYTDFGVNSNFQFVAARGSKDSSDFLIDVLDATGKLQFSFGNPIRNNDIPFNISNTIKVAVDADDNVVIVFQLLARIQKYDKNGSLLHDIQLTSDTITKDLIYNKKQFETIRGGKRVGYHRIIEAVRIRKHSYHILRNGYRRIEIFEVDDTGKITRLFFYPAGEDYYATDFDLIKNGDEVKYYILEASPECRVGVYQARY
jgi:hypothetical protein